MHLHDVRSRAKYEADPVGASDWNWDRVKLEGVLGLERKAVGGIRRHSSSRGGESLPIGLHERELDLRIVPHWIHQ